MFNFLTGNIISLSYNNALNLGIPACASMQSMQENGQIKYTITDISLGQIYLIFYWNIIEYENNS